MLWATTFSTLSAFLLPHRTSTSSCNFWRKQRSSSWLKHPSLFESILSNKNFKYLRAFSSWASPFMPSVSSSICGTSNVVSCMLRFFSRTLHHFCNSSTFIPSGSSWSMAQTHCIWFCSSEIWRNLLYRASTLKLLLKLSLNPLPFDVAWPVILIVCLSIYYLFVRTNM